MPLGELEKRGPNQQLAFFEMVWPTYPWIHRILACETEMRWTLFVETIEDPLDEAEWGGCRRVFGEILELVLEGTGMRYDIHYGRNAQQLDNCVEVLSDEIFKAIAKEVTLWRLEVGR